MTLLSQIRCLYPAVKRNWVRCSICSFGQWFSHYSTILTNAEQLFWKKKKTSLEKELSYHSKHSCQPWRAHLNRRRVLNGHAASVKQVDTYCSAAWRFSIFSSIRRKDCSLSSISCLFFVTSSSNVNFFFTDSHPFHPFQLKITTSLIIVIPNQQILKHWKFNRLLFRRIFVRLVGLNHKVC